MLSYWYCMQRLFLTDPKNVDSELILLLLIFVLSDSSNLLVRDC